METNSNRSFDETPEISENNDKTDISVELVYTDRVNFAAQQNLISIFQELVVSNDSDRTLENLRVVIKSEPKLLEQIEVRIDRIEPQTRLRVEKFAEKPDVSLLGRTSERVQGEIELAIFDDELAGKGGKPLFSERYPITIFPWDEWSGNVVFPSLLAAFVTPNADGVVRLASDACEIMKSKGQKNSLEGYQFGDKDRVYEIIQAIYEAVLRQGIRYANPPASFEAQGQRIRFVDRILREKLATCLDFSTLFASVLEYCGLNPIIFLIKGHAFVGCHLLEETFGESYVDREGLQAIRKRVGLDQIAVFETTCVTSDNRVPFTDAEKRGKERLNDESAFEGALDVARARHENIRPIPLNRGKDGDPTVDLNTPGSPQTPRSQSAPRSLAKEVELPENPTPKNRIDRWKQKLLDLTFRNKLLNFSEKSGVVTFLFPETKLAALEDALCNGEQFQIVVSTPEKEDAEQFRSGNYRKTSRFSEENLIRAFRSKELRIRPGVDQSEANKRLTKLTREASTSASESGVNSLFLAFGTVERFDKKLDKTLRAPLLLIPVKLTGNAQKNDFCLTRVDEDATLNATLLEHMRVDYGKEIRGLDPNNLPTDASGVDVEVIFQIFQQELLDFSGWELKKELTLGLFSFQKFVMWSDLNAHLDDLTTNPIVRHFVETPQERYSDGIPLVDAGRTDSDYSFSEVVTPLSADSSQLAAILTAEKGKSFVLQGPPGTGKSQTIANIIAYCLYRGQRVLFVAEKRAALEVVYRRLCQLGLGAFCLELHSNKSGKRQILDQLNEALEVYDYSPAYQWDSVTHELETLKNGLNEYVEELHRKRPNDLTLYYALGWLASHETLKTTARAFKLTSNESFAQVSAERFNALLKLGESLRDAVSNLPETAWEDLRGVALDEWSLKLNREIDDQIQIVLQDGEALREGVKQFAASLGVGYQLKEIDDVKNVWSLGRKVGNVGFTLPVGFYSREWDANAPKLRQYLEMEREVEARLAALYRNGWEVLLKRRESGSDRQRGISNDFELDELRSEISNVSAELAEQDASTRQIRSDFASTSGEFYAAAQKTLRRVGLQGARCEGAIWRVGELIKSLAVARSPKSGFLLGDWDDFFIRTKRCADAVRARSAARGRIAPFDYAAAFELDFSCAESGKESPRLPVGLFDAARAYDSSFPIDGVSDFARAYGALLKEAVALNAASAKTFGEIGLKDAINENNVSIYRPIFGALTEIPPRSQGLLSDDWTLVAPRLRRSVETGEKYAKARGALEDFNLNVVLDFDVERAKRELDGIPQGAFTFANVRKQRELEPSAFGGLSLDSIQDDDASISPLNSDDDSAALDEFSHKITRLIRATRQIVDELEIETPLDERTAAAIARLTAPMKEFAAPTEDFLSDDWLEFKRDARALIDANVKNKEARETLARFDLEKIAAFDVGAAREKWTNVSRAFFLFRKSKKRAFVAEIATLATNAGTSSFTFDDAPGLFDAIENYVASQREIEKLSPLCAKRLGQDWNADAPDRTKFERLFELGDQIVDALGKSPFKRDDNSNLRSFGRFWFASAREFSPEHAAIREFGDAWQSCAQSVAEFVERVETIQIDLTEFEKELAKDGGLCAERFGEDWRGAESDWSELAAYIDSGERVANAIRKTLKSERSVARYLLELGKIWTREKIENGALGAALREFCDSWTRCFSLMRELAPEFNAWKENYRRQEETIRLETAVISERFSAELELFEWESVAESGDMIVKQVRQLFPNVEVQARFLKTIDELWFSLNATDGEDAALVDAFLTSWKRYEETAEKFFNSLDVLPPGLDEFNLNAEAFNVQKIDLTNLAASLVEYVDAYTKLKRCESELGTLASIAKKDGKYERNSAGCTLDVVEHIDTIAKRVSSTVTRVRASVFFESLTLDAKKLAAVRDKIGAILADSTNPYATREFGTRSLELEMDFNRFRTNARTLKSLLKYGGQFEDTTFLDSELEFARRMARAKNERGAWIVWNQVKAKGALEFPGLIATIEARQIESAHIADVVRYLVYSQFVNDVVDETTALKEFCQNPDSRENMIERFQALDKEYVELSKRIVVSRLTDSLSAIQGAEDAPRESELGKLRREIKAKRHSKSVRTILGDIPTLLPKLKPCLLMSPLSVAQYFPSDSEKYDVVIFDEASQIPLWDAVGAIARGRRLIVVGDTKQLPPTSFFQRAASDDDDELSEITEPESVLDECLGAQIPEIQLRWHYRSKREGLIAFSNQRYYDDRLYTFPSVDKENTGVKFVYVPNGRYDRGGSKTNQIEARALVDAVVQRLSDPAFSGKSLGIVTFNEAQKNAIEDLLDVERRNRPEIEPFFNPDNVEPVFVKNLENVQGDERDVMYFSICFGPDSRGVVSLNFGPLNKSGGERRLNVAITRAKEENVVFSSIRARDLKLTNGASERGGVRDLKDFLDYAESGGKRLIEPASSASEYDYDSPFEEEVAKFLRAKGYEVKTQVGCSKYRIDLAIVAPDESDEYVVGVECDGAAYHASATARDRDFLRQRVLEGLGWRIVRVWSTRWFYDRENAEKKLLDEIAKAFDAWKEAKRSKKTARPCNDEKQNAGAFKTEDASRNSRFASAPQFYEEKTETPGRSRDERENAYPSLDYLKETVFRNRGDFYDWRSESVVKRQIKRIVEVEGPITEELLLERIKAVWNFARAGNQIKATIQAYLSDVVQTEQSDGTRVYWDSGVDPSTFQLYRTGGDRKFSEIPLQEFFNAVERVKAECGEFADDDSLYREVLRRFGVQRLTQQVKTTIERELRKR